MSKKRFISVLLIVMMLVTLIPPAALANDGIPVTAEAPVVAEIPVIAEANTAGVSRSAFSGRLDEWAHTDVAYSSVTAGDLTFRATTDGETLFTIVEGAFRDTRNVYYISIAGQTGGFERFGRPNVHFIVANGYLYRTTANQDAPLGSTQWPQAAPAIAPEWFGPFNAAGVGANANRMGRISMEYHRSWTGMRLYLEQFGIANLDPADINISWQGFSAANNSTTPAHIPADTTAFMPVTASFTPLREEGVYYPQESFDIILNPLVGGGASLESGALPGQVMGYAYVSWRSLEPVRGQLDLDAARIYTWGDYPIIGPNRDQWHNSRAPLLTPLLQTAANNGRYIQLRMIMDLPEGHRSGVAAPAPGTVPSGVSNADWIRFLNLRNRTIADIPDWAVAAMRRESNRPLLANGEPSTCPHNIPNVPDFDPGVPNAIMYIPGDTLYTRMRDANDPFAKFFEGFRDQPFVHYANPIYYGGVRVTDGLFRCAIPNPSGGTDLRVCPNGCIPYRRPAGLRASTDTGGTDGTFQQLVGWNPDDNWGPEGTWYLSLPRISGGVGLQVRFDHHMLLHYHENIMNALAEEIARPGSPWNAVAQVQLGSLGFWGEWHNWPPENAGTFPNAEIAYPFVRHYMEAFASNPNVQIGMRYANWIASKYDLGFFHDEAGQGSHFTMANTVAQQNLSPDNFAANGWGRGHGQGDSITNNRNANMVNVPAFTGLANATAFNNAASNPTSWMRGGWSGGEYGDTSAPGRALNNWEAGAAQGNTPTNAMDDIGRAPGFYVSGGSNNVNNHIMNTIYAFRWNNVSNLAPRGPAAGRLNPTNQDQQRAHKNNDAAYDNMGYRFVVEEVSVDGDLERGETVNVNMLVNNRGVAPFYRDWPLEVSFINAAGEVADTVVIDSVDIRDWMPRHRAINNARPAMTNYEYVRYEVGAGGERIPGTGHRIYYRTPQELSAQGSLFIPAFDGRNDVEFTLAIPENLPEGEHTLAISIPDPILPNGTGIRFHNTANRPDGRLVLAPFVVGGEAVEDTRTWNAIVVCAVCPCAAPGTLAANTGSVVPGQAATLTLNERTGLNLTAVTVSGTGIDQATVTTNLAARTVSFEMPAGADELAVVVRPTWGGPPAFDPGEYSLRLQGNGTTGFRPHQSIRRSTVTDEDVTLTFWVRGTGNVRIHISGPPNVDLFNGPVDVADWTQMTTTTTMPSAGWATFLIEGSTTGDNEIFIDNISLTGTGAAGVFFNMSGANDDNLNFERFGMTSFAGGGFGSGRWYRSDWDWIGSPVSPSQGGAFSIVPAPPATGGPAGCDCVACAIDGCPCDPAAVTRAAASTVSADNMTIAPTGVQPVGTLTTVTVTPPAGYRMVPGSLSVTGVPGIVITSTGAIFPVPAGGGEIIVNAEFEAFIRTWNATVTGHGALAAGTGSAEIGDTVTLTLDPRAGYNLTAIAIAGTGINQESVTRDLDVRTVSFVMPEGSGALAVTVTPTWTTPPDFDPGNYSIRLQGDGSGVQWWAPYSEVNTRFNPNRTVPMPIGDTFTLTFYARGNATGLTVLGESWYHHLVLLPEQNVNSSEWTRITHTFTHVIPPDAHAQAGASRTVHILAGADAANNLWLDGFSLVNHNNPEENLLSNPGFETGTWEDWWQSDGWAVTRYGEPANPGNNWSIVRHEGARTWNAAIHLSNNCTCPCRVGTLAADTGSAEPGGPVTLTLDPVAGHTLTAIAVAGTGINQGNVTVDLTARTVSFVMPEGSGALAVTVTPTWTASPATGFDPGSHALRLQGNGTVSGANGVRPHQWGHGHAVGDVVVYSLWVRGAGTLDIRITGAGNPVFFNNRAINYGEWTRIESAPITITAADSGTLIMSGATTDGNVLWVNNIMRTVNGIDQPITNGDFETGDFSGWRDGAGGWPGDDPARSGSPWSIAPPPPATGGGTAPDCDCPGCTCVICGCAEVAGANEFFVATDGNNTAGDGSKELPWATVAFAMTQMESGDTLNIRGGTYSEAITVPVRLGGNSVLAPCTNTFHFETQGCICQDDPHATYEMRGDILYCTLNELGNTIFRAYPGETVIFRRVQAGGDAFLFTGADNLTVEGIRFEGFGGGIRFNPATAQRPAGGFENLYIRNNVVAYNRAGNSINIYNQNPTAANHYSLRNVVIEGNHVHDGRSGWTETVVVNGNVNGIRISDNLIHNSNNIAIDLIGWENGNNVVQAFEVNRARNILVHDNVIQGIHVINGHQTYRRPHAVWGFPPGPMGNYDPCSVGIYFDSGFKGRIFNNFIFDVDIGMSISSERVRGNVDQVRHPVTDAVLPPAAANNESGMGNNSRPWYLTHVHIHDNIIATTSGEGAISIGGYSADRTETFGILIEDNILFNDRWAFLIQNSHSNIIRNNVIVSEQMELGYGSRQAAGRFLPWAAFPATSTANPGGDFWRFTREQQPWTPFSYVGLPGANDFQRNFWFADDPDFYFNGPTTFSLTTLETNGLAAAIEFGGFFERMQAVAPDQYALQTRLTANPLVDPAAGNFDFTTAFRAAHPGAGTDWRPEPWALELFAESFQARIEVDEARRWLETNSFNLVDDILEEGYTNLNEFINARLYEAGFTNTEILYTVNAAPQHGVGAGFNLHDGGHGSATAVRGRELIVGLHAGWQNDGQWGFNVQPDNAHADLQVPWRAGGNGLIHAGRVRAEATAIAADVTREYREIAYQLQVVTRFGPVCPISDKPLHYVSASTYSCRYYGMDRASENWAGWDFTNAPPNGGLRLFIGTPPFVPVTGVTGAPTAATVGVGLPLTATVAPDNATNQTIVWSVYSAGTTGATITGNTLHTTEAGTVVVRATIANGTAVGTAFTQNFTITVNPVPTFGISLTPDTDHTFPAQIVGYSAQTAHSVTVGNTGNQATGELTAALSGANPTAFTLSAATLESIPAGTTTRTFTVVPNTGLAVGTYTATVTVSNAANEITESFHVSFTVNPVPTFGISLTPDTDHTFPAQIVGYSAQTAHSVTVENTGNQATGELTAALSGANPTAFTLSAATLESIPAGTTTRTFTVVPNTGLAVGTYTATVTVSNAANEITESFHVSFTVNPVPDFGISLTPDTDHTFPAQIVGYNALTAHSVTVGNTGNQATGALTVALSGANPTAFTLSAAALESIPAGTTTRTFTVVPNTGLAVGTYTATVTVRGGNGISETFRISFTVHPVPAFGISLTPGTDHTFPAQTVGYGAQTAHSVTVGNTGNQATGALTVALSGANPTAFTVSTGTLASIPAGTTTRMFTVTPNPGLTAGTYTATVTVSGGNGISETFHVSFTVQPSPFVPVTGITGAPTAATVGVGLPLAATVAPDNATNRAIVWSVYSAGTTGATITGNTLNTTAAGTVVVRATIADGTAVGTAFTQNFTITVTPAFVPVTGITGVPTAATVGVGLPLTATVAPDNATNQIIVWTVSNAGTTGATISGGALTATGAGTATVTATIANGTAVGTPFTATFPITVTPAPLSADATLQSLRVVSEDDDDEVVHALDPEFDPEDQPEDLEFVAEVPHAVTEIEIDYTAACADATVEITRPAADPEADPVVVEGPAVLAVGENVFTITVTAADGTTVRVYTVTVTRGAPPSSDADLSGLRVVSEDADEDEVVHGLDPAFNPAVLAYTVNVLHAVTEIEIDAAAVCADAAVVITRPAADPEDDPVVVEGPAALALGENVFTITVTAADGETVRVYTVTVTRGAEIEEHLAFMFGNDEGHFMPRRNATRADVAAILARVKLLEFERGIEELPAGMSAFTAFSDVDEDDWFYYYVAWAYDAGLVRGDDTGRFRPHDPITRQEFAAMLARTLDAYEEEAGQMSFRDAGTITSWAAHYVYTVYSMGWMVGDDAGNFNPLFYTARADVATAMNRILGRIDSRAALNAADVENQSYARNFPDVAATAWYFPSVMAAANDHRLTRDAEDAIDWKYIIRPAAP